MDPHKTAASAMTTANAHAAFTTASVDQATPVFPRKSRGRGEVTGLAQGHSGSRGSASTGTGLGSDPPCLEVATSEKELGPFSWVGG